MLLLLTALLGTALVSSIPRLVMAGLIVYIGMALLFEWVVAGAHDAVARDYAVCC